jgi:hypothetical protein
MSLLPTSLQCDFDVGKTIEVGMHHEVNALKEVTKDVEENVCKNETCSSKDEQPKHTKEGAKRYSFQKRKAPRDLESKKKTSMMSNITTTNESSI